MTNTLIRRTALAALAAGVALGTQACARPDAPGDVSPPARVAATASVGASPAVPSKPATSKPASSKPASKPATTPSTTKKAITPAPAVKGDAAVLAGKRQVAVRVQEAGGSALRVSASKLVEVSAKVDDAALFVLTPVGRKHQIKTAKLRAGGEPYCLAIVDPNPQQPRRVAAVACDAAASDQLFTVKRQGTHDGSTTWSFNIGDHYVQWISTGSREVVAEVVADSPLSGHMIFVDKGRAALPALD